MSETLEKTIERLEDKIRSLEEELEIAEDANFELESKIGLMQKFELTGIHDNLRTVSVMEDLFANLDHIPVDALEKFVEQFKVFTA